MSTAREAMSAARDKFRNSLRSAAARGVAFSLTFEQWWDIWQASGHWHQRGVGRGLYVLARFSKRGGFELGNVRVCVWEENAAQRRGCPNGWLGRHHSVETRAKISAVQVGRPARRGWKHLVATKAKISAALKGRCLRDIVGGLA